MFVRSTLTTGYNYEYDDVKFVMSTLGTVYYHEYEDEDDDTAGHLLSVLVGPWQCRRMQ